MHILSLNQVLSLPKKKKNQCSVLLWCIHQKACQKGDKNKATLESRDPMQVSDALAGQNNFLTAKSVKKTNKPKKEKRLMRLPSYLKGKTHSLGHAMIRKACNMNMTNMVETIDLSSMKTLCTHSFHR